MVDCSDTNEPQGQKLRQQRGRDTGVQEPLKERSDIFTAKERIPVLLVQIPTADQHALGDQRGNLSKHPHDFQSRRPLTRLLEVVLQTSVGPG
jgi:hypothetical protein